MTHHEISVQGRLLRIVAGVALLGTEATFLSGHASAQEIDFGQINKFESLTTGTLRVGAPAKTIIDDGELGAPGGRTAVRRRMNGRIWKTRVCRRLSYRDQGHYRDVVVRSDDVGKATR